jgi:hypothetical protein
MAKVLNYDIIMARMLALTLNSTNMPNWCSNTIEFRGDKKSIDAVRRLLERTIEMADKTNKGQILFGLEGAIDGYMFNPYVNDEDFDFIIIMFDSKWYPIPNDMVRIAEVFNLSFEYDYEESGNGIYGKYLFDEEELLDQHATDPDIESCRFKEHDDEDGDMSGFDYEKLYSIIEHSPTTGVQIHRINEKDLHS